MENENFELNESEQNKYKAQYSDEKLWSKLGRFAKKAGLDTVYYVLLLYYVLISGSIKDKIAVTGALGYFISPIDFIPDIIPVTGFSDDIAVLLGALGLVATSITPEVKAKAKAKLHDWFDYDESELNNKYV